MEKAKNDDKLKRGEDRFNPNVAFLVIVLCFIALMLFRLDLALRSIWINEIYPEIAPPVVMGLIIINVWLLYRWNIPCAIVAGYAAFFWGFLMSFSGLHYKCGQPIAMIARAVTIEFLAVGAFIILTIWVISQRRRYPSSLLKAFTLMILLIAIHFIVGIGFSSRCMV